MNRYFVRAEQQVYCCQQRAGVANPQQRDAAPNSTKHVTNTPTVTRSGPQLTDDEWRDDELDEAHLHVAEADRVAVAHGGHLQTHLLLLVALQAELL
jgi:hypothetical protein